MNNETVEISMTKNFFHRYLLGTSIENILIRLTIILSSIIIVWSGIMLALIIHTKYQRRKQIQKSSTSHHHHLHDSTLSLTKKRSHVNKRFRRTDLENSSSPRRWCYFIRRLLTQLKQRCVFWPTSRNNRNENSFQRRKSPRQPPTMQTTASNKVQLVVEAMTRRPLTPSHRILNSKKKNSFFRETDSSSGDESKYFHRFERDEKTLRDPRQNCSSTRFAEEKPLIATKGNAHHPSISFPINHQSADCKRLQQRHELNAKATLLFHPLTRRLSHSTHPPFLNAISKQQENRPSFMISSVKELTSNTSEWHWPQTLINDSTRLIDQSLTSSSRQLPLVMITDTSSSNTNIVDLETYEDQHRLVSDIERRLLRELRASYRPRHST